MTSLKCYEFPNTEQLEVKTHGICFRCAVKKRGVKLSWNLVLFLPLCRQAKTGLLYLPIPKLSWRYNLLKITGLSPAGQWLRRLLHRLFIRDINTDACIISDILPIWNTASFCMLASPHAWTFSTLCLLSLIYIPQYHFSSPIEIR